MPKKGSKQWQHPAESLLAGHILYTVKFLGECSVEQPKGTEVVKEAIRKMKFNKHIKRAEGQKPPKVELTISADAVTILERGSKNIMFQYPLHRISYCADDKSDKRMFTFIAKEANGPKHFCYVFDSDKCAEEITLTIGQAFDLAYKRFLDTSTQDGDIKRSYLLLQKKMHNVQFENETLKKRIAELEKLKDRDDVEEYKRNNQSAVVGRRLENLGLGDTTTTASTATTPHRQTNGRTHSDAGSTPILSPPPSNTRSHRSNSHRANSSGSSTPSTPAGANPFFSTPTTSNGQTNNNNVDPFGMDVFSPTPANDQMMDMEAGFSRGLSFGTDDFSLDDLDPLNQKL